MASHTMALDSMDDFFDFDRLEHDVGVQPSTMSSYEHPIPLALPEDVMVLDWAADGATMSSVPAFPPQVAYSSDVLEYGDTSHDRVQWPLRATPYSPLPTASEQTDPHLTGRYSGEEITSDSALLDQGWLTDPAPSSSFINSEQLGVTSENRGDTLIGAYSLADELSLPGPNNSQPETRSPEAADWTVGPPRGRSSVPLRQASTATWKPASAKRKGPQSRIPLEAKQILEDEFAANPYPCSWEMDIIAHQANLDVKKVRNWYNNTRARKKGEGPSSLNMCPYVCAYLCLLLQILKSPIRIHLIMWAAR